VKVEADKATRREFALRVTSILLFVLLVGSVAANAVLAGEIRDLAEQIRETQLDGTPTGKKLLASSERVLDCTSPNGKCFKRGQAATAAAVGDITQVVILAAACSGVTPGDVDAITRCVVSGLTSKP
jgi:hypothetical protein